MTDRERILAVFRAIKPRAVEREMRTTCWICEKPIEPDKAPRALCGPCACIPNGGMRS